MLVPRSAKYPPKVPIPLSPTILLIQPPSLGRVSAASAISLIASAAHDTVFTVLSSNVPRLVANAFRLVPRSAKYPPKVPISLSPTILPSQPPSLGSDSAASAIAFIALAAHDTVVTVLSSNVPRLVAKSLRFLPRAGSCEPNFSKEEPPVIHEVSPSRIFAAVNMRIVSANAFTPLSISGLRVDAPSIKGVRFVMNSDRLVPIAGRDDAMPSAMPPTRPPTSFPMTVPIFCNNSPPCSTSQVNPGI